MKTEKEKALEAVQNLITYYTSDFKEGCGYAGKQLIHLTKFQAETALRYGVPIGIRDTRFSLNENLPKRPYRYITIRNTQALDQQLAAPYMDSLVTIHADLPRQIQQIMRAYILQIMEIEGLEQPSLTKPVAPLLGAEGNVYNLLCITRRTLQNVGQQEQAEEMWQRALDSRDNFKAIAIMGEYVEFGEVNSPKPNVRPRSDIRGLAGEDRV